MGIAQRSLARPLPYRDLANLAPGSPLGRHHFQGLNVGDREGQSERDQAPPPGLVSKICLATPDLRGEVRTGHLPILGPRAVPGRY